jgi:hypothetical protein
MPQEEALNIINRINLTRNSRVRVSGLLVTRAGYANVMLKYIQIETETGYNRYSYGRGGIQVHRVL